MATPPEPVRDLDWDPKRARALGEGAVDLWEEFLVSLRELPIKRRHNTGEVRRAVTMPVPDEPLPDEELLAYARKVLLEYSMYPGHPGFMAYISGPGTVPGAVADFLAAAVNQNVGGWRLSPAASEIELHLTRWFAERFDLPEQTAGGFLVSGGAMANFVGLKVARDQRVGAEVRRRGLAGSQPLALYASVEVHAVIDRAADMIGIGMDNVRKIPVNDDFRMRTDELRAAIERDVTGGILPVAVVGSAGTVNTGAVDPFEVIADICAEHGMWFHVDGAYGGPAAFAEDLRPQLAGIERADSIGFDPHKWLYTPHSGGCVLLRDLQHAADAFGGLHPSYIHEDKEAAGSGIDIGMLGPQFSRGFQAFKVWLSFLAHGAAAYSRRISHDAALARYMGERVQERPEFELATPVSLSICCFRYVPPGLPDGPGREGYLDTLNERIMTELQLDGRSYCSNAVLRERFVLRACIVNFRTEAEDVDELLDVAAELGWTLDSELRPAELGT